MSIRTLIQVRKFSMTSRLWRPKLSSDYKSKSLWEERFTCPLLSDEHIVKKINNKILAEEKLDNLELDIFVNISSPSDEETVQLEECASLLSKLRKSLEANTMLPSTPDAMCRLFLDSHRMPSLITMLNSRIEYGLFPNSFSMNLLLDESLDNNDYVTASKLASLVMLQEEFGINHITDTLALYSIAKYIESHTNFEDWPQCNISQDTILNVGDQSTSLEKEDNSLNRANENKAEDENEEDDEYIRVPFLRNPYFDDHFDLTDPRLICGKTLSMLSKSFTARNKDIATKSRLLGSILEGNWAAAIQTLVDINTSKLSLGSVAEVSKFYLDNLHSIKPPDDKEKDILMSKLNSTSEKSHSLSDLIDSECSDFTQVEKNDIQVMRDSFLKNSELREEIKKKKEEEFKRAELIALIKKKKEELKLKEQYLYFYDNLKKKRVTRIDYT